MSGSTIAGILLNSIMIVIIILILIAGFSYRSELNICQNYQSPYCYAIQCPCDNQSSGPCFGYAKMPGPQEDTWYCSNAPTLLVDDNGNPV